MTRRRLFAIGVLLGLAFSFIDRTVFARPIARERALRAAVHPVADAASMRAWLARVPVTRDFPPDFTETLRAAAGLHVVDMSIVPGCLPCADLWERFAGISRLYGWRVRTIPASEAMIRSGRLGLPWVGHPVAWVHKVGDADRAIPVAIGTDRRPNLARNLYLAVKMLGGVRPDVGVRAMAKYTGIVDAATVPPPAPPLRKGRPG